MQTGGTWLRQAREAQGETLEQAAEATCIRLRFLEALEAWDLAAFPGGDVQIRGFLSIYARHLGFSADDALARYQSGLRLTAQVPIGSKPVPTPAPSPPPPVVASRPRWMRGETFIVAAIVLILLLTVGAGGWYLVKRRFGGGQAVSPIATATVPEAALYPPRTPANAQISPLPAPTIQPNPEGGVTVALEATEHVWARVTVDDVLAFEGMLAPGEAESWSGQQLIVVDTGNGAGLLVTVNDQPLGAVGGRGELCSRGWGPGGEVSVPELAP